MKYLIIGRAGCGRKLLLDAMEKEGLSVAKSMATRKPRWEGEDSHAFVDRLPPDEDKRLLQYGIGNASYCYLKEDLEKADAISLDPGSIRAVSDLFPDEALYVVYMKVEDDMARKLYAIRTADNKIGEEMLFDERDMMEDEAFSQFEQDLGLCGSQNILPEQVTAVLTCSSIPVTVMAEEERTESAKRYAEYLKKLMATHDRMRAITMEGAELGILRGNDGKITIEIAGSDGHGSHSRTTSADRFVDTLMSQDEGMARFMREYVALSDRFKDAGAK